jgi:hypothetical protein
VTLRVTGGGLRRRSKFKGLRESACFAVAIFLFLGDFINFGELIFHFLSFFQLRHTVYSRRGWHPDV